MELSLETMSGKDIAQKFDEHQNQLIQSNMAVKYLGMREGKIDTKMQKVTFEPHLNRLWGSRKSTILQKDERNH